MFNTQFPIFRLISASIAALAVSACASKQSAPEPEATRVYVLECKAPAIEAKSSPTLESESSNDAAVYSESGEKLTAEQLEDCKAHLVRIEKMTRRERQAYLYDHFEYGYRNYPYSLGSYYYGKGHGFGFHGSRGFHRSYRGRGFHTGFHGRGFHRGFRGRGFRNRGFRSRGFRARH